MLLTPGPVPLPPFVQKAMRRPIMPHRSAAFTSMYGKVLEQLAYLFQTQTGRVGTMAASGTGGVEAAMYSLFGPGDKVTVVSMGKFSERWASYGHQLGCVVHTHQSDWGKVPAPVDVVAASRGCRGVILTHCETSTGACLDLEEAALALRRAYPEILIVVDGITTIGAQAFYFDAWEVDCAVVASQKALMAPAGLAAFALSERALAALRPTQQSAYLHLGNYLEFARKQSYPFTPPLIQLFALEAALDFIREKSLPTIWNQSQQAASYFRQRLKAVGGSLFPQSPSFSLSVFSFPGADHQSLKSAWEAKGFAVAGGQGKLAGQVLRVSHMGMAADLEVVDSFWEMASQSLTSQ